MFKFLGIFLCLKLVYHGYLKTFSGIEKVTFGLLIVLWSLSILPNQANLTIILLIDVGGWIQKEEKKAKHLRCLAACG